MTRVRTDRDRKIVIRRHRNVTGRVACRKETALARRLRSAVAVPAVVATDPDGRASGAPQSVWEFVGGERMDLVLPRVGDRDAAAIGRAVGGVLARIGAFGFPRPGALDGSLVPDGRPVLADLPAAVAAALDRTPTAGRLTGPERTALRELAERSGPPAERVRDARRLVHMDFNPKNLLVAHVNGTWSVAAVVDWELAHSGSPLTDVGNMLRFAADYPPGFDAGFVAGFRDGGGALPHGWRRTGRALDLFTLSGMHADLPDGPQLDRVVAVLRARLRDPGDRPDTRDDDACTDLLR